MCAKLTTTAVVYLPYLVVIHATYTNTVAMRSCSLTSPDIRYIFSLLLPQFPLHQDLTSTLPAPTSFCVFLFSTFQPLLLCNTTQPTVAQNANNMKGSATGISAWKTSFWTPPPQHRRQSAGAPRAAAASAASAASAAASASAATSRTRTPTRIAAVAASGPRRMGAAASTALALPRRAEVLRRTRTRRGGRLRGGGSVPHVCVTSGCRCASRRQQPVRVYVRFMRNCVQTRAWWILKFLVALLVVPLPSLSVGGSVQGGIGMYVRNIP